MKLYAIYFDRLYSLLTSSPIPFVYQHSKLQLTHATFIRQIPLIHHSYKKSTKKFTHSVSFLHSTDTTGSPPGSTYGEGNKLNGVKRPGKSAQAGEQVTRVTMPLSSSEAEPIASRLTTGADAEAVEIAAAKAELGIAVITLRSVTIGSNILRHIRYLFHTAVAP